MRIVEEIPHPQFKITIFSWNEKYIVKIEIGQFEQVFKIREDDVMGIDDIKLMLNNDFLSKVMNRFVEMRSDFAESFKNIQ